MSKIDRVAQAILTAAMPHANAWDMITEDDRNRCREQARAAMYELAPVIERAFRDGLAYGSNVRGADPDTAWAHSLIKAEVDAALAESAA